ncbi:hypothetical protein [Georgenia ruanii]|uniref:hypothetical protein n=1 Tax=Georgenia ruanii TaxID=348442 RepID=UPI00126486AD|nr:hypothetical protein [Georgenia ruanii]
MHHISAQRAPGELSSPLAGAIAVASLLLTLGIVGWAVLLTLITPGDKSDFLAPILTAFGVFMASFAIYTWRNKEARGQSLTRPALRRFVLSVSLWALPVVCASFPTWQPWMLLIGAAAAVVANAQTIARVPPRSEPDSKTKL